VGQQTGTGKTALTRKERGQKKKKGGGDQARRVGGGKDQNANLEAVGQCRNHQKKRQHKKSAWTQSHTKKKKVGSIGPVLAKKEGRSALSEVPVEGRELVSLPNLGVQKVSTKIKQQDDCTKKTNGKPTSPMVGRLRAGSIRFGRREGSPDKASCEEERGEERGRKTLKRNIKGGARDFAEDVFEIEKGLKKAPHRKERKKKRKGNCGASRECNLAWKGSWGKEKTEAVY